jgi:exonuclease SbcC
LAQEEAGLEVQNDQLYAQMKVLQQRVELLEREADEAQCPLCRQTLSDEHRTQVLQQFQTEGKELGDAHRANTARRHEIASERRELEARIQHLDRELASQPAQQRLEAQLEQAVAKAHQAATNWEVAHAELTALEGRLKAADFAAVEQAELARLAAEAEAVGYERTAHQQASALAAELAHFETANQRLQAALDRVDEERATLKDLRARRARWEEDLANDRAQCQGLAEGVARLPEVTTLVAEKAGELERLQAEASRTRLALGAAQQKLDHCQYLAQERIRHEASRKQKAEEKAIFEELRLAFGKRGIQAMIIEAAIPEIEYEANQLLARMTDGRMHVRFETQRETLKGDMVETLDINIADELGTRPYELFSGGEAFRVNFAIRIALSKLLARRAGAQLQMLVIDEGFGTQDAEGRERLVEAINSIQEEFARILVITHIEELKDAFPVWIEVTKTAEGSQIRLN